MRIIEQMAPCNCQECKGKESLIRIELVADAAADLKQLEEVSKIVREMAAQSGKPVTEKHIHLNIHPAARTIIDAARFN